MPIYIAQFAGSGKWDDPFCPSVIDWQNQGGWGLIDLRPDGGATLDGNGLNACILSLDTPTTHPSLYKIAESDTEKISVAMLGNIHSRLSLPNDYVTDRNINDILFKILRDAPTGAWKPLRPSRTNRRYEIWLAGRLLKTEAAIIGPSTQLYTEDFNGSDKAGLGYDHTWTERVGTAWNNASNQAKYSGTTGLAVATCDSALDTDDHYCESDYISYSRIGDFVGAGPMCRKDASSTQTFYYFRAAQGLGWSNHNLEKYVAGSNSTLDSSGEAPSPPERLRCECDGSTIKGYVDEVEKASDTDTSITGNVLCGFYGYSDHSSSYIIFDNWEAGDLGGDVSAIPTRGQNLGMALGMPHRMGIWYSTGQGNS